MKSSKNIINRIKSKYVLNVIFDYIDRTTKLKIIRNNKNLQSKLNVGEYSYIFNELYTKLDSKEEIELYYNSYFNRTLIILNIIDKYIKDKEKQKKFLIDFFKDLYYNYYKDLFILYYNASFFDKEEFKFLLSLNSFIKI